MIVSTIVIACVYFFTGIAHAHGAGMTLTATTAEGYVVDVDYSDLEIQAGRIGRFDFDLFTDDTRSTPVPFTEVWMRITKDTDAVSGSTLFAGGLVNPKYGGSGISIVFPEGGAYTLSIRYTNANDNALGETVGEAEFKIPVVYSENENKFSFAKEFWAGLLVGLFGAIIIARSFLTHGKKT